MTPRPRVVPYSEDPEFVPCAKRSGLTRTGRNVQPSWPSISTRVLRPRHQNGRPNHPSDSTSTSSRRRQNGGGPNHPSPASTSSPRRQNGSGPNHPSPSTSAGHQQLLVTSDLHIADDINVCDSLRFGGTNPHPQTTNNVEEKGILTCILSIESQSMDKSLKINMESQKSPIIREPNNVFSSIEIPSRTNSILPLGDENQGTTHQTVENDLNQSTETSNRIDKGKYYLPNVTTKEVGLCFPNLSLEQIRHAIINKYGDIAKECTEPYHMRTTILNGICDLVKEIGNEQLENLDDERLHDFILFSERAEQMKFNVGWLRKWLDELIAARRLPVEIKKEKIKKYDCEDRIKVIKDALQRDKTDLEWKKLVIANKESELASEVHREERLSINIGDLESMYQHFLNKPLIDGLL